MTDVFKTRPAKIRAIYAELRRALGKDISMREAMEAAAILVDLAHQDPDEAFVDLPVRGGQLAVDTAFADGGWRLLCREQNWFQDNEAPYQATDIRRTLTEFGLEVAA
ncbi:hypothetical protein ABWH98_24725 [Labrenzia sp. ac12]